ncbi:MAG: DUF3828 domain-containing protein [Leptospiraceae bacterium]|nr:DUF3828 domain-containing protein [Leptospiraceae bacterium]MCP5500575.1 DUF3828 domain-containing protein [Leptospiraceae bacterium]
MKYFFFFFILWSFFCKPAPLKKDGIEPAPKDPAGIFIYELYKTHNHRIQIGLDGIIQGNSREELDRYFEKELGDLLWDDVRFSGEEGSIKFDILYQAQEFEIHDFHVKKSFQKKDVYIVPVEFYNFEKKMNINYHLIRVKDKWKIVDIEYSKENSLKKILVEEKYRIFHKP